jgi:hypothetical protein
MSTKRVFHFQILSRRYRAIRTADLAMNEVPIPAGQALRLVERELLRPSDLASLMELAQAMAGANRRAQLRAIWHGLQSGVWALLPPVSTGPVLAMRAPEESVAEQLRVAKVQKTWVEMEVVDDFGQPVTGQSYLCMMPDGKLETGTLDGRGRVRFDGIDPGTCVFSLVDLDEETWAKAS